MILEAAIPETTGRLVATGISDLFPDEEEKDDDYIEYDVHLRSHCIARCVSKLDTSPFEEGGKHISL